MADEFKFGTWYPIESAPFILDMRDGQKYDLTVKVTDWPEPAKVFQKRLVHPTQ